MEKIAIVGGSGFIGSYLTKKLLETKQAQITIIGEGEMLMPISSSYITHIHHQSLKTQDDWNKAFHEVDFVYQLAYAGIPFEAEKNYQQHLDINLAINNMAIEASAKNNIKQFIFASSGAAYGAKEECYENMLLTPSNAYGAIKATSEIFTQYLCRKHHIPYTIARISNPFGPYQEYRPVGFIAKALECLVQNKPLEIWGDGSVIRDYIFIEYLASMLSTLCQPKAHDQIYNLSSGLGFSLNQIIAMIQEISPYPLKTQYLSSNRNDLQKNILNNHKFYTDFPNVPITNLKDGVDITINYLRNQ